MSSPLKVSESQLVCYDFVGNESRLQLLYPRTGVRKEEKEREREREREREEGLCSRVLVRVIFLAKGTVGLFNLAV